MINTIWLFLLCAGILVAAWEGQINEVTVATWSATKQTITIILSLAGIIAFWSGMMKIAEESGFTRILAQILSPLIRRLFPEIPRNHPALGAIALSMSANLLGLGNASTPLGIKAMEKLQEINPSSEEASNSMCTYVVITTSSLTLVPATVIGLRIAAGSNDPTSIIGPTIFATSISTIAAIGVDILVRRLRKRK